MDSRDFGEKTWGMEDLWLLVDSRDIEGKTSKMEGPLASAGLEGLRGKDFEDGRTSGFSSGLEGLLGKDLGDGGPLDSRNFGGKTWEGFWLLLDSRNFGGKYSEDGRTSRFC